MTTEVYAGHWASPVLLSTLLKQLETKVKDWNWLRSFTSVSEKFGCSRYSLISIVSRLRVCRPGRWGSILDRGRPAICTGIFSSQVNGRGVKLITYVQLSTEGKNTWGNTFDFPYAFVTFCLIKHSGNFVFSLPTSCRSWIECRCFLYPFNTD